MHLRSTRLLKDRIDSNPYSVPQIRRQTRSRIWPVFQTKSSIIERTYLRLKLVRVANYPARAISVRLIGVNVILNISDPCLIVSQCLAAGVVAPVVF